MDYKKITLVVVSAVVIVTIVILGVRMKSGEVQDMTPGASVKLVPIESSITSFEDFTIGMNRIATTTTMVGNTGTSVPISASVPSI